MYFSILKFISIFNRFHYYTKEKLTEEKHHQFLEALKHGCELQLIFPSLISFPPRPFRDLRIVLSLNQPVTKITKQAFGVSNYEEKENH